MRVLVVGASRGIGKEFVRQLCERGDETIATVRSAEHIDEELSSRGVRYLLCDVRSAGDVEVLGQEFDNSALDLLINNAGVYANAGALGSFDYDEFLRGIQVNALGPLRIAEALLPALRRGEFRRIVHLTSKMGSIGENSSGGAYAYRMSKAALNAVHRSLSLDLADEGFACLAMHPGWVKTDMGGPRALIDVETSVASMLRVIDEMGPADNGTFREWSGGLIPW